jgi:hypothetical protein
MLVLVYEGSPDDPMTQFVRVVRASSLEEAEKNNPHAIMTQKFEQPTAQQMPDIKKLRRGQPVWSF